MVKYVVPSAGCLTGRQSHVQNALMFNFALQELYVRSIQRFIEQVNSIASATRFLRCSSGGLRYSKSTQQHYGLHVSACSGSVALCSQASAPRAKMARKPVRQGGGQKCPR
eukprot:TRINITY_DN17728_c0_g1_i1.p1 TRINITY_DN17728_c0_g1~~TRINITY_DN17728_c0_g1_i1.p1  ORF type:complete len:111 (-),score=8.07 TRINITY_DN17728_c0_g1_i1:20-352(-)